MVGAGRRRRTQSGRYALSFDERPCLPGKRANPAPRDCQRWTSTCISSGFPVAEALSKLFIEVDAPRANGFTGHADAPFQQEFFNIAVAQCEAVIQPYGVLDQGKGKTVTRELLAAQHRVTLPQQLATTPGRALSERPGRGPLPHRRLWLPGAACGGKLTSHLPQPP